MTNVIVPALPGCHTWGESYEQLLEILADAIQAWLEVVNGCETGEPNQG